MLYNSAFSRLFQLMAQQQARPKYLNLFEIRMPVGAVASIAHRISGVLLFLSVPVLIWLLERSLSGPDGYALAVSVLGHPLVRLVTVALVWALLHHLLAGIRFLLIDLEIGVDRAPARTSAWLVNLGAPVLALLLLGAWW